jgi:hypothetical protein
MLVYLNEFRKLMKVLRIQSPYKGFHDKSADDKSAHDNSAQTKPHCHKCARDKSAHGQIRTRTNTHMYKCAYSQYYQVIHS